MAYTGTNGGVLCLYAVLCESHTHASNAAAQIFGTPSELVEMFDMAHVLIFLIVVLFVGMIAVILWRFAYFCREWDDYEVTAMECVKQGKHTPSGHAHLHPRTPTS